MNGYNIRLARGCVIGFSTMFAMLLIGCFSFSAYGKDYTITNPRWGQMSKKDKDKFIEHLVQKKAFRKGRDRITYKPSPKKPTSHKINELLCLFLGDTDCDAH